MAEDTTGAIPSPLADDDEDLVWALTTASTMWKRGDRDEAIRWVKRAVEHAADNDLDDRAIELGKLVAELATKPLPSANAKPSAAPPPPPPAATKTEAKKKSGLTGKHAAIRDAAPATKSSGKTGKHKAIPMSAVAPVIAKPEAPAAKPAAPSVPRPSTTPRAIATSEPRRPTSPPPPTVKRDENLVAAKPSVSRESSAPDTRPTIEDVAKPDAPAIETTSARESKAPPPSAEVSPASSNGTASVKAPPPAPRSGTAPLPSRPTGPSIAPSSRSVAPPNLGASPSMRPGSLPSLKAPPLPAITKDLSVPVPKAEAAVAAPAETLAEKPAVAASNAHLLQSIRVYVSVDANGPRITVAREGITAPEGAIEAVLVATQSANDLLSLLQA